MFNNFFPENRAVYEIMPKHLLQPGAPQMAIWRCVACWVNKATRAQTHASSQTPAPTPQYKHTHTCARAYESTRTHSHTQKRVILIAFLLQQWFPESASVLHCKYIACIVSLILYPFSTVTKHRDS
jgi:hypothetical protein